MLRLLSFLKGESFGSSFYKFSCANDCCNSQTDIEIKIITKAPVAPYFSSIYTTLVSIVCGLALGSLLTTVTKYWPNVSDYILYCYCWKIFNVFLIITIIWHHYIIHNQFVAWDIGWRDTLIPFGFAFLLMLLISTIDNIKLFSYNFTLLCLGGFLAYSNSTHELKENKERIIKLYQSVFGDKFAECLYKTIVNFETKAKNYFLAFSIFFIIMSFIVSLSEVCIMRVIILFFHTVSLIIMINLNLIREVKKLQCIKLS